MKLSRLAPLFLTVLAACSRQAKPCQVDIECAPGKVCEGKRCVLGQPCGDSASCPPGKACRFQLCGTISCITADECLQGEACQDGVCTVVGCRSGADCASGLCNPATHACVECLADGDCPAAKSHCGIGGACVGCRSDADCAAPAPPFCNPQSWNCAFCATNADCPAGLSCDADGRCAGSPAGGPCDANRLCGPNLVCATVSGASQCLELCNPYHPSCSSGVMCALLGDQRGNLVVIDGLPVGACLDEPGVGLSQACSASTHCQGNLVCLPDSASTSRCRRLCDPTENPSTQCPGTGSTAGMSCNHFPTGYGPDNFAGVCYAPSDWNKACRTNLDCGPGFACTVLSDPASFSGASTKCGFIPTPGAKVGLDPCAAGNECQSNLCLKDGAGAPFFCYGACAVDADCPGGGSCGTFDFATDPNDPTAIATLKGCHPRCASDAQCSRYGAARACVVLPSQFPPAISAECGPAFGQGANGAGCTTAQGCRSGLCLSGTAGAGSKAGLCSAACQVDADCGAGTGLVCPAAGVAVSVSNGPDGLSYTADDSYASGRLCAGPPCLSDADCPAALPVCAAQLDPASPRAGLILRCDTAKGALAGGAACAADADCQSARCLGLAGAKVCFMPCKLTSPTPCPGALACRSFSILSLGGSALAFDACGP